nr:hypothetical protein [bacterium]
MKKILLTSTIILSALFLPSCKKKTNTNTKTDSKTNTKTITKTKVNPKTVTTSNTTTSQINIDQYKNMVYINLNFGDYGTYGVDEKYVGWHSVNGITSECFPFDLNWTLHNFKGWAYNGTIIYDNLGNKVNEIGVDLTPKIKIVDGYVYIEETKSIEFNAVFEKDDELVNFDYSMGMSSDQFDIYGVTIDDLSSVKELVIPNKITWNDKEYKIYRIHGSGDKLHGCNNLEKLTIPYANGISSAGFLSYHFGCLWGTKEFENSYEITGYYLRTNQTTEYTEATYYIPKSLKTIKITGTLIDSRTFANYNALKDMELIITKNMKTIYSEAFYGITETLNIYYEGTFEEFDKIDVRSNNSEWLNAN